jgi:hypothetical protein
MVKMRRPYPPSYPQLLRGGQKRALSARTGFLKPTPGLLLGLGVRFKPRLEHEHIP